HGSDDALMELPRKTRPWRPRQPEQQWSRYKTEATVAASEGRPMSETTVAGKTFLQKLLDGVETVGNKVPHPAVIFLLMSAIVIVLSHVFHLLGSSVTYQVIDPTTHKAVETTAVVNSLLTVDGIRLIITSAIRNFLGFTPVGVI